MRAVLELFSTVEDKCVVGLLNVGRQAPADLTLHRRFRVGVSVMGEFNHTLQVRCLTVCTVRNGANANGGDVEHARVGPCNITEVVSSPAQGPEKVGVLSETSLDNGAVSKDTL